VGSRGHSTPRPVGLVRLNNRMTGRIPIPPPVKTMKKIAKGFGIPL